MRGKHDRYGHAVAQRRIIPAHAGQTALSSSSLVNATDHPRACGANVSSQSAMARKSGSSPRMRGKQLPIAKMLAHVRIIPAHAGQTVGMVVFPRAQSDHPRVCGANGPFITVSTQIFGSSPRMRGKRRAVQGLPGGGRIIPAHAGQTSSSPSICQQRPDHPRACGANQAAGLNAGILGGSSPRMRGKLSPTTSRYNFPRIIPAHAGQTAPYVHRTFCRADHPRACGANGGANCRRWHAIGSSPRMRGKPRLCTAAISALRIIPAHAGQTCGGRRGPACSADHPRACGANIGVDVSDAFGCGSSPRMRGKLPCARSGRRLRRIIPAHAGQTTS